MDIQGLKTWLKIPYTAAFLLCLITANLPVNAATIAQFAVTSSSTGNLLSYVGEGTATLDDSGELVLLVTETISLDGQELLEEESEYSFLGSFSNNTLQVSDLYQTILSCTNLNAALCPPSIGEPFMLMAGQSDQIEFDLAPGGLSTAFITAAFDTTVNYNLTTVPIPAAAWLFGTALIGLTALKKN